ncbi:MAG: hypothetical protein ACFFD2_18905 [Promethearchaeota archaeon]
MSFDSIIFDIEDEEINFEDKLSLLLILFGAIFFGIIVISVVLNLFQFEQMEVDLPFF